MLTTVLHRLDFGRRDLRNVVMTALLGALFGIGAHAVVPAASHPSICSMANVAR